MSADREPQSSVRVELGAPDATDTPNVPSPSSDDSSSPRVVIAVVVAIVAVLLLLFALRPDDGRSAAGTPITVPTAPPPETSVPIEPGEDPSSDEIDLESAEMASFPFDVVETRSGWVGLAADPTGSTALWRSVDGLLWSAIPADDVPEGDIIGVDYINGEYLIAVDVLRSRSQDLLLRDSAFPEHDVQVFRSGDAVTWSPDSDFAELVGSGFPLSAQFSEDALLVPMVGPGPDGLDDQLIELLGDFMPDAVAIEVCRAVRRPEGDGPAIVFLDCLDEELLVLTPDYLPEWEAELFGEARIERCIDAVRFRSGQREYYNYLQRSEPLVEIDARPGSPLNGVQIPGGVLMVSHPSINGVSCPDGLPLDDSSPREMAIERWTRSEGLVAVAEVAGSFQFVGEMAALDDGRVRISTFQQVWESSEPYADWEVVFERSDFDIGQTLSLAPDGSMFVGPTSSGSLLFGTGDAQPFEVDLGRRIDFVQLVIAEPDYAIVAMFDERGATELTKVPFG